MRASKNGAVTIDMNRRRATGALFCRDLASRCPGASLQYPRQRKGRCIYAQLFSYRICQPVQQSHSECAPLYYSRLVHSQSTGMKTRIACLDHTKVKQQAAVAIFGQAGECIETGDFQFRLLPAVPVANR